MDRYPDACNPTAWANAFYKEHFCCGPISGVAEWFKMAFRAGAHGYNKRDHLWKPGYRAGVKVGDTVYVRGTVRSIAPDGTYIFVACDKNGSSLGVLEKDIVHVESRKLAVGDHVSLPGLSQHSDGVILAVDGDDAWVLWSNGDRYTYKLEGLLRMVSQ